GLSRLRGPGAPPGPGEGLVSGLQGGRAVRLLRWVRRLCRLWRPGGWIVLTVTEANAMNKLVRWILGEPHGLGPQQVTEDEALRAVEVLVASAYKRLMAGISPEEIRPKWSSSRFAALELAKQAADARVLVLEARVRELEEGARAAAE